MSAYYFLGDIQTDEELFYRSSTSTDLYDIDSAVTTSNEIVPDSTTSQSELWFVLLVVPVAFAAIGIYLFSKRRSRSRSRNITKGILASDI